MGFKATSFIGSALTTISIAEGHLHNAYLATPTFDKKARAAIAEAEDLLSEAIVLVATAITMKKGE